MSSPLEVLRQAVLIALDPTTADTQPALQAQANQYCQQVKESLDGWRLCLGVLEQLRPGGDGGTAGTTTSPPAPLPPQVTFFALQVLEEWLRHRLDRLSPEDLRTIRSTVWRVFVLQEASPAVSASSAASSTSSLAVPGPAAAATGTGSAGPVAPTSHPLYIRNKVALLLILLFRHLYAQDWSSFFTDWLNLLESGSTTLLDLFLRVCLVLDQEVVCLLINRSKADTDLNIRIKDQMRMADVALLMKAWLAMLLQHVEREPEIANVCFKLFSLYAPWNDLKFLVQGEFLGILYQALRKPAFRVAACDCLNEMVLKGMPHEEKLRLLAFLNLDPLLTSTGAEVLGDEGAEEFAEALAKLANSVGIEACYCFLSKSLAAPTKEEAYTYVGKLFDMLLQFLGKGSGEVSAHLYPFLGQYLSVIKVRPPPEVHDKLNRLLNILALKFKYATDFDPSDEEEEAELQESRKTLKPFLESIGAIDSTFFSSSVHAIVVGIFASLSTNSSAVDWTGAELAMYLLYLYTEIVRDANHYKADAGGSKVVDMLGKMLTCQLLSRFPRHEAVVYAYFDAVIRQSPFFEHHPAFIPAVLSDFVGTLGLHHASLAVRSRLNYLFLRFAKPLKHSLSPFVKDILVGVQDLLVVRAPAQQQPLQPQPPQSQGKGPQALTSREGRNSFKDPVFDSQIYLLEAVGVLISAVPAADSVSLLNAVVMPLLSQVEEIMANKAYMSSEATVFQLHHLIIALGSIAKGYPDRSLRPTSAVPPAPANTPLSSASGVTTPTPAPAIAAIFKRALYTISVVLENLKEAECIRDASRFTFQRMVGCLGDEVLELLQVLIRAGLFSSSSTRELVDFLPFLCLLSHTFKVAITPMFQEMYPHLFRRAMYCLELEITGTDERQEQVELKRAFLSFLASLLNSGMDSIFLAPENMQLLDQTLAYALRCCRDVSDHATQKLAFSILAKMVTLWGGPPAPPATATTGTNSPAAAEWASPLPGFDQYILGNIVPVLFEMPARIGFSASDKQAYLILNEVEAMHRAILTALRERYPAFLDQSFLPSLCFPAPKQAEFLHALRTMESRTFRKYLQEFIPWLQQHVGESQSSGTALAALSSSSSASA